MIRLINKKILQRLVLCILVFCTIFISMQTPLYANAEESSEIVYTGVLEDLKKDSTFDVANYPTNTSEYSLKVIQIAESVNNELFVYVYQPSGDSKNIVASSINISTTINDAVSYHNYKLVLINSSSVFYKYRVSGLAVKSDKVRYYVISSIYRKWNSEIDEGTDNDNEVTEVNYEVAKQYCFGTINGNPYCSVVDIETIVITDKFVGFVRYMDGFKLYIGACDSHFVAFNTDKPIDKLLEADVYYTTQSYASSWVMFAGTSEEFGDKSDNYAYLKYTDKVTHNGGGLFAGTYTWDRIQSVENFIANEDTENIYHGAILDVKTSTKLTDEALQELQGKKWVLRFKETSYTFWSGDGSYGSMSTIVGDVTILRLKFETDGITYNLGVIDNKQSGGTEPSNETEYDIGISSNFKTLLCLVAIILLIIILSPVLPYILKGIVWIISAPFKFFKWLADLIKKCSDKDDKGKKEK